MKTYGYARVSTRNQELARQIDMLNKMNCDEILTEKISGVKKNRQVLTKLKRKVRPGDTIIIESFSRLGRSTRDLIELVNYFEERQVKLMSLKENFDTTTPQGKLMMTVFQAFSQFERDIIVERTREGLRSARARGKVGGRPKINQAKMEQVYTLYDLQEQTIQELAANFDIGASTIYKYLKRRRENDQTTQKTGTG